MTVRHLFKALVARYPDQSIETISWLLSEEVFFGQRVSCKGGLQPGLSHRVEKKF